MTLFWIFLGIFTVLGLIFIWNVAPLYDGFPD